MIVSSNRLTRGAAIAASLWFSVATATAQMATAQIVRTAKTFLSTLDQKQRQSVMFAFDDQKQRANWSNLPTSFVPRGGISFKEMNATQRSAAMALVASALSRRGYEKVQQIMEGDEVLRTNEVKNPPRPGGNGGGPPPGTVRGAVGREILERTSTTSRSSELPPRRAPGCCSSVDTIWRSTSPSPANKVCLRRL